jgi:hypothetical protein
MSRRPVTSARKPTMLTWTPRSQPRALYMAPFHDFFDSGILEKEEEGNG